MSRYRITTDPAVAERRQRLAGELNGVLEEVGRATGWVPRRRGWLLLVAGVAAGFTLALALKAPKGSRGGKRRRSRDPLDPDDLADSLA